MSNADVKIETAEVHYPALDFFVRHGHPIAALCGLSLMMFGVWLVRNGDMAAIGLFASFVGGCVVYLLVRVFWDIARLLSETMIPR